MGNTHLNNLWCRRHFQDLSILSTLVNSEPYSIIQPIFAYNGSECYTKFYKADFFTNTLDMTP